MKRLRDGAKRYNDIGRIEDSVQKPARPLPAPPRAGRGGKSRPRPACARDSDEDACVAGALRGETDRSCEAAPRAAALLRAAMDGVCRKVGPPGLVEAELGWIGVPEPTTPPLRKESTFSERLNMELATPPAMPTAPGVRLPDRSEDTDGEALPSALRRSCSTAAALGVEWSERVAGVMMREMGEGRIRFAAGEIDPPPTLPARSTKVLRIELSLSPRGRNARSSKLPLLYISSSEPSSSLSSRTC